jgi:eukaryotic-like serine/threonine-protein kinase
MSAADKLAGLTLENGWQVTRHLARNPNGTGGTFSQSYEVRRNGRMGFLKAFDFSKAFDPGVDTLTRLQEYVGDYTHEREILRHCSERKLSNVVIAVDHGEIQIQGLSPAEGRVYYLIFEMADCDVRVQMDLSKRLDALQCMIALKDVTLGLHQVHKELIAHQDTKPSNVLVYGDKSFKIADFGRSSKRGQPTRHDTFIVAGDRTYAPPELLYDYTHPEFVPRRIGCDMYMLGNLAGFLFSGTNITASLIAALDPQHHPRKWGGTYREIVPYLQRAFTIVLADIAPLIDELVRDDVLNLLREQCNPDLERRGHPKRFGRADQYSLERHVSHLDLTAKRLAISRRVAGLKAA